MNDSAFHEQRLRGTFDFPIEFHYVDARHPQYEMPFHWHTEYEFVLVLDGVFRLSLDGNDMQLGKGDVALIQGGVVHGGAPVDCTYECLVLDLFSLTDSNAVCQNQLQALLDSDTSIVNKFSAGTPINGLVDRMFEALEKEYSGYELTVKGLLLQILGELINGHMYTTNSDIRTVETRHTEQLKNSLRYIRKNYSRTVTLDALATAANMSPKYFCRFFKEMVNRTPIDYLNYYRIERACDRLVSSGKPITEIALDCGFNDLSYFIKTFKRYKEVSPKQYQKIHKLTI